MSTQDNMMAAGELRTGRPVKPADAVAMAEALLQIAEKAMPATYFATDSRCEYARQIIAAAKRGDLAEVLPLDAAGRDLLARCRSAIINHGGHPYGGWPTREQLAVAIVLRDRPHLEAMGYTLSEAVQCVLDGMVNPPDDVNAWIAVIRRAAGVTQ